MAKKQNEITSVSGATTPTYDANGNLTKDENNYRFVFDAWNRQAKIKNASDTVITTNEFDGLNRKIEVTASGVTVDRIFSEDWQILEEKVGANFKNRYVWSPSYIDALVTRDRDTDANGTLDERLFAQHEANFNVTAITNTSGTVQERYTPDPFGVVTFRDASGGTISASAKDWVFLHQGGQADILGHYDFRNRILSPTLGRWLTNDPLGVDSGDNNFYGYVGNCPASGLDPLGLQEKPSYEEPKSFPGLGEVIVLPGNPELPPGRYKIVPGPNGGSYLIPVSPISGKPPVDPNQPGGKNMIPLPGVQKPKTPPGGQTPPRARKPGEKTNPNEGDTPVDSGWRPLHIGNNENSTRLPFHPGIFDLIGFRIRIGDLPPTPATPPGEKPPVESPKQIITIEGEILLPIKKRK